MTIAATEHDLEQELTDGTQSGEDPDNGKLFEVPRVAVTVDDADPNVIKLAFSGTVELERSNASDVAFYNRLRAGSDVDLHVQAFVAGPQNTHRRDGEGNVDAVVQTKSLKVHSITLDE